MNSCIYLAIVFVVLSSRLSYTNAEFRVINGKHIKIVNSAHTAAIFIKKQYQCVGTLVTFKSVVTVATCVFNFRQQPAVVDVQAGMVNMHKTYKGTGQKQRAKSIIPHPSYTERSRRYMNIAVVILGADFQFSFAVNPIHLCDSVLLGMEMKVSGWGAIDFGEEEPPFFILKTTKMTIMQKNECQKNVMETLKMTISLPDTIICADGGGSYLGAGDSGAGGIVDGKLCAVAHGVFDIMNTPNLFTNVTNESVLNFLKTTIACV